MAEQLLNGRYRLLRPLGTGGMASVYLAEDLRLGRRVAIKILHPQFAADPQFVARFEQEARMAAGFSHPNLVQVYDVGHDGDRRYIVMEYVEGQTLKELIARQGPLPVPRALAIISGVLDALSAAHAHNLIHRDIKAQNILITSGGEVKVTDFGIARELAGAASPTLTMTGMVIGTVQYFSPEQAQGKPATARSDIYSAGIVLYEMLTGALPFEAENPLAVAMQQINQAPPRPTRVNGAIPPSVEAVVLTALAKQPDHRYADAAAMKAAVEAARSGAAEPTRRATRVTPAAGGTGPTTPGTTRASVGGPSRGGPPRTPTRTTPVMAAPPPTPRRRFGALWWIAALLVAVAAAALGAYFSGAIPGLGGATATPTVTASPTATLTNTPSPSATHRPVVVPPTDTNTARPTRTATPTTTDTPRPTRTATSAPTATDSATPAPTDTATRAPTDTATPAPTDTATSAPTDTATPAPTDTPTPSPTSAPTDTATPAPSATPSDTATPSGPPAIQLQPSSAPPGGTITITGSGWPDGTGGVDLSADFGQGNVKLGFPGTTNGAFSIVTTIPSYAAPGNYTIVAKDSQGDSTGQQLTVT